MATTFTYQPPALVPTPDYDDPLEDLLQRAITGITGLDPTLVRPRWQVEPANQPDFDSDWVAFGITATYGDQFSYQIHDPTANAGLGGDNLERDEFLRVLLSFYGPHGSALMGRFRDGLQVDRNRDELYASGVKLIEVMESINLPALLKERWVRRIDLPVLFGRRIRRAYGIPSVVGGQVSILDENRTTVIVNP